MPEIKIDWVQTARANAVEMEKGRMQCRPEEAALLRGLADEIERLKAENKVFREHCAAMNNLYRNRFYEAVVAAVDEFFSASTWPRKQLKEASDSKTGGNDA